MGFKYYWAITYCKLYIIYCKRVENINGPQTFMNYGLQILMGMQMFMNCRLQILMRLQTFMNYGLKILMGLQSIDGFGNLQIISSKY